MAVFQLTISPEYVSDWGIYEGIREIVQNALDARDDGHELSVSHDGRMLHIASQGARLDRSVWLMGQTSKTDGDYRGHWGEGLKLGCLALARAGRKVRIRNTDETWTPSIEPSKEFGQPVLTITTRRQPQLCDAFAVEVQLTPREWSDYREKFLEFRTYKSITSSRGSILPEAEFRGQCYVKGIWVEENDDLAYGYDYLKAKTDRDRRIIDRSDARWERVFMWRDALSAAASDSAEHRSIATRIYQLLVEGKEDLAYAKYSKGDFTQDVEAIFRDLHGEQAIPVCSDVQQAAVAHYGLKGILVSEMMCDLFSEVPGMSVELTHKSNFGAITHSYSLGELDSSEQAILHEGIYLVAAAASSLNLRPLEGRVAIVDFCAHNVRGIHGPSGEIKIARTLLNDLESFLQVLVHELAHDAGNDGSIEFDRTQARIWSRIVSQLLEGTRTEPALIALAA